jgi:hypothetical protein
MDAMAIIANSSPAEVATGELMVLKNTIKKYCKGGEYGQKLVKIANSELGGICSRANHQNLDSIRRKISELCEHAKVNNQARLRYELLEIRSTGL